MNSDTDLDALLKTAIQAVETVAYKAFEAGVKRGREDAAREFQAAFNRIVSAPASFEEQEISCASSHDSTTDRRAAPGTVRPAIIAALAQVMSGLRPADIAAKTKLSENTIRGTLRSMRIDGITEKRGELWFLTQKNEAAGTPSQVAPTASDNELFK